MGMLMDGFSSVLESALEAYLKREYPTVSMTLVDSLRLGATV